MTWLKDAEDMPLTKALESVAAAFSGSGGSPKAVSIREVRQCKIPRRSKIACKIARGDEIVQLCALACTISSDSQAKRWQP